MDKFGIFKLLNSFFSLSGQNGGQSSEQSQTDNINFDALLNAVKSGQEKNANQRSAEKITVAPHPPLQSGMLNTMTAHDAFIKRVKEKNKT